MQISQPKFQISSEILKIIQSHKYKLTPISWEQFPTASEMISLQLPKLLKREKYNIMMSKNAKN